MKNNKIYYKYINIKIYLQNVQNMQNETLYIRSTVYNLNL